MEDLVHLHTLHRRIALASRIRLRGSPCDLSTPPPSIPLPRPLYARPHHCTLPHLWLPRHLPPLRNILHGKYHGCFTPSSSSLVRPHGSRRVPNIHIRGLGPAPPPRHNPHNHRRNILDNRTPPVRYCSARRKLLGLYLPLYDLRYHWHRYYIQRRQYLHHHFPSAKTTGIGGCGDYVVVASGNCGLSWVRGHR